MEHKNIKYFNKKFFISALKVLSFLIAFMIILEVLSCTVFSKKAATQYQNTFSKSCSFTTEPENSIDIALIGSSDLYSGFIPIKIWDKYGYTSTVISTPKQTVSRSYTFLEELLKTQKPKLLVIETDMFYAGIPVKGLTDIINDKANGTPIKSKLKSTFKIISNMDIGGNIENRFTAFMFHDEWKKLKKDSLEKVIKNNDTVTCEHGYNFNKIIFPANDNNRMDITNSTEKIPEENIMYIKKMLNLCDKMDIKIIFLEMPSLNSWNYARHNAVEQFAQNMNIEFVDMNMKDNFDKSGIKCETDFRDNGEHLNYYGAEKATLFFGDIIENMYDSVLYDKRDNHDYMYWHKSSDAFKEKYNIE